MTTLGISVAQAANTLTVCANGCGYTSIQAAITVAGTGDTINVEPGTYNENLLISTPGLTLQSTSGPGTTFINASITQIPYAVQIDANNVTLSGFDISSPGYTGGADASGVVVEPVPYVSDSGIRITNNIIHDIGSPTSTTVTYGVVGINIGGAEGVEVDHNIIYNIIHSDSSAWANGISIWGLDSNTPSGNISIHDNSFYDISSPYTDNAAISTQTDVDNTVTVYDNSIVMPSGTNEYGVEAQSTNAITASDNYWGSPSPDFESIIQGDVTHSPWYTDSLDTTLSTNANLTSLSLSSGTLSPAFSSSTTSYAASVANGVTSINVSDTTNPGATAVVSGNTSLVVGSNTVTVMVTSADGTATQAYTVTVNQAAPYCPLPVFGPPPTTGPTNAPPPTCVTVPASTFGTPTSVTTSSTAPTTVSGTSGGTTEAITVPAGALPSGTTVSVFPVTNTAPLVAQVPAGSSYVLSFAVNWEAPDGTSPAATAPITITITDPGIVAGDTIYELTSAGLEAVGTATANGTVTITFSNDPTFLVTQATVVAKSALSVTTLSGRVGTALSLVTSGGSGTGAVSFTVTDGTATGCTITGSSLTVTGAGTCLVTASKAADSTYSAANSAATTVTFAAVVLPAALHAIKVNGAAVVGRTVTLAIVGTGFYGAPKITSNEAGTMAVIAHDSGKLLTVRVMVKAGSRKGEHTFTIRLANGKSCRVNYVVA
jgi:hypothetical protein